MYWHLWKRWQDRRENNASIAGFIWNLIMRQYVFFFFLLYSSLLCLRRLSWIFFNMSLFHSLSDMCKAFRYLAFIWYIQSVRPEVFIALDQTHKNAQYNAKYSNRPNVFVASSFVQLSLNTFVDGWKPVPVPRRHLGQISEAGLY